MVFYETRCWKCGKQSNRAVTANVSECIPSHGDINICTYCGTVALFDVTVPDGARKPSPEEMDELMENEDVHRMLAAWHKVHRKRHSH